MQLFLWEPQVSVALLAAAMSLIAFCLMGVDKRRAMRKARRIPERTLWLFALLGGGLGGALGMRVFHHKTRHRSFRWGFPGLAALQLALLAWLSLHPG